MATEAQLVTLFAALVAIGAVLLLFVPVLRRAWESAAGPLGYGTLLIGILAACVVAVALVILAASDPALAAPLAAIVVVLRVSSPPLLYLRVRSRLETKRVWDLVRVGIVAAFVGLAASLATKLIGVLPDSATFVLGLSEQVVMALGAASLFVRIAFRARPHAPDGMWPFWLGGILFGVAFLVVAPYAFPDFAIWYIVSGIAGWALGAAVAALLG